MEHDFNSIFLRFMAFGVSLIVLLLLVLFWRLYNTSRLLECKRILGVEYDCRIAEKAHKYLRGKYMGKLVVGIAGLYITFTSVVYLIKSEKLCKFPPVVSVVSLAKLTYF